MTLRVASSFVIACLVAGLAQGQQPAGEWGYPPHQAWTPQPAPFEAHPSPYQEAVQPPSYPVTNVGPGIEGYPPPAYNPYLPPHNASVAQLPPEALIAPTPYVSPESFAPPLAPAPEAGPSWFDKDFWFPSENWDANIELGINGATGNAESLSIRTGGNLKRKTESNELTMLVNYGRTRANSVLTQHNALYQARSEWLFPASRWTMFGQNRLEYDAFKEWDLRWMVNGGVGCRFFNDDTTTLTGRVGGGVSREIGGPQDEYLPEALFGLEYSHQFTNRQSFTASTEYMPVWNDFSDFRMITNLGWIIKLDDVDALSLKLALIDRYDSTPHGRKPNDLDYSLLLLWKL